MRLEGKVAVITGAASGIGRATAMRFAAEGAHVMAADLDDDGLAKLVDELGTTSKEISVLQMDVTSREDTLRMVDQTLERFDRLDILINNAGINRDALAVKIKDETPHYLDDSQWDPVLAVNLKGSFLCAQAASVPMIRQGSGHIVNTASVAALGNIGQANYSASKAGVIGLTRTLALEWARFGIKVNCVAPGATRTQMTAGIPDKIRDALLEKIPLRRMAEPEEIAAVHLFLVSNEASYITGQVLFVDGGATVGV